MGKITTTIQKRSYLFLPLILILALLISCIVSPYIKIILDKISNEQNPIAFIVLKAAFIIALFLFIIFRKKMKSDVAKPLNLPLFALSKQLFIGLLLCLGSALLLAFILWAFGVKKVTINFGKTILWKILVFSFLVGVFEEIFHRGFILQNLKKDIGPLFAVVLSSAFYSAAHFLNPYPRSQMEYNNFSPLNGFKLASHFLDRFSDFDTILPFAIGLFLLGVLFSIGYLKTNSLYFPIGFHTALVFLNRSKYFSFETSKNYSPLVIGGSGNWFNSLLGCVIGWAALVVVIIILFSIGKKMKPKREQIE